MIKPILVFMLIIVFLFGECTAEKVDMNLIQERYRGYEQELAAMSPDLHIFSSDDVCQDGCYYMYYSLLLKGKSYYLKFKCTAGGRETLEIELGDIRSSAMDERLHFFAELIDKFGETGKTFNEIEAACHEALNEKYFRFNRNSYLEVDELFDSLRYRKKRQ